MNSNFEEYMKGFFEEYSDSIGLQDGKLTYKRIGKQNINEKTTNENIITFELTK